MAMRSNNSLRGLAKDALALGASEVLFRRIDGAVTINYRINGDLRDASLMAIDQFESLIMQGDGVGESFEVEVSGEIVKCRFQQSKDMSDARLRFIWITGSKEPSLATLGYSKEQLENLRAASTSKSVVIAGFATTLKRRLPE